MDKLYFLEDIQSDPMNYANELSEFNYDVASVGRSMLVELMDKNVVKGVEKRAHERFQTHKDAFALIRPADAEEICIADKNMAEIACSVYRSKPVRFGRINDISMGGLSFHYITGEERSVPSLVLDILVAESGFYLKDLTFKNISDVEIEDQFAINTFKLRLNRVQFEGLELAAMMKLKHFVENFSASKVQQSVTL